MRRSRILLLTAPFVLVPLVLVPGQTKQNSYERTYLSGGGGVIIAFKINPGGTNPGQTNPSDLDPTSTLDGSELDQTPLAGTPLDQTPLRGTPADQGLGGVTFEEGTFEGEPFKLRVEDASGFPVPWSACQQVGPIDVCGANGEDNTQGGCGTPEGGEFLAGFRPDLDIGVWILTTDSGGTFSGTQCDGPSTTGTVTLITKV